MVMQKSQDKSSAFTGILGWLTTTVGRIFIAIFVPAITLFVLWQVFLFLRDSSAPQIVIVLVAIVWGVAGVALLYVVSNWVVEQLPGSWPRRLQPFVYIGPAVAIMGWYLAIPVLRTLILSFKDEIGASWVGFDNYHFAFTDRIMLETFRNNLLWMIVGTSFSVGLGLLIAVLADRSRFEAVYKSIIFMPMAISFVGAGVIWKFVYTYKGEGVGIQEIGLLNAIVLALGGQSRPWLSLPPWNNLLLIIIMIWLQTGFSMVVISSAIKGIPMELLEAARIDGATEIQAFFKITIPYIKGTLITVITTIVIFSLKLFDIVRVMTGGNNGTNVIANEFYLQRFTYGNTGRASAIAIVLLVAVIPVIINNLREFNKDRSAF
ncbi:MAG: sugar ABC transporter permease [Anaerolineaceae bacterium]|nr:MAG: sugar ABC transporter permease [Anaerolineaceae bacterium]